MGEQEKSGTFVVYRSFWENIKNWYRLGVVSAEEALNVFFAMGDLGFDGEEAELSLLEEAVFAPIRPLIAASRKRYEEARTGGARRPTGITAEEVWAKKEELGTVKAVAKFYGISERTVKYRLAELRKVQGQVQSAKVQEPNVNLKLENENLKLALAPLHPPAACASSSRAVAAAGSLLATMSEQEEQQAQAIFDRWKKPKAGAAASKESADGKQLTFDFLITEAQRKIDEAKDKISRAWYAGEKRSYEDAKKLVETSGMTAETMRKIKESAENARKQCENKNLTQDIRTQFRAYSRASMRVLRLFFEEAQ